MSQLLRLSACAALVAGCFAATWGTRPAVLRGLGLDLWEWPRWQNNLDAEHEREGELTRRWQISERREWMKTRICRDVIDGRLTVREAARRFAEMPDPPERLWEDLRLNFPEGTDEERMCRHVIEWAGDLPPKEPSRAEELRRRLREELRAGLGRPQGPL
jgi:hypothetical protein